jgi:hypothetical protein
MHVFVPSVPPPQGAHTELVKIPNNRYRASIEIRSRSKPEILAVSNLDKWGVGAFTAH